MKTRTHTALIAIAAGLMTLSALPVSAADQQRPPPPPAQDRDHDRGPARPGPEQNRPGAGPEADRYGAWNASWGARPPAPPRGYARTNDWHRHVRACQQRYRSYNPATDRYVVRRGQTAVCRL